MSYASETKVPIIQSQGEIRRILDKYGATGFVFGEQKGTHLVMFRMAERMIKFVVPMPLAGQARMKRGDLMTQRQVEQEERRRWRCLALVIKAKLEAVESGIATIESEFMAQILLPNGQTVGEAMMPQIDTAYRDGKMPPLLGYAG
jgi:hypothetical protein